MAEIKNIHLLTDIGNDEKEKMEHAGKEHRRHGSIEFKILENTPKQVVIRITQGKNAPGIYQNQKRLNEIVHETFGRFFKGKKIIVRPFVYKQPPVNLVDAAWINKQMLEKEIKLKTISDETGLNKTYLSSIINGNESFSQLMKCMFWFYFLHKGKTA